MSADYISRLTVIKTDLKSLDSQTKKDAVDALFELWLEFIDDPNFHNDLRQLYKKNPFLDQGLTDCIDTYSITEKDKAEILREKLDVLSQSDTIAKKESKVVESDDSEKMETEDQENREIKSKKKVGFEFSISGSTAGIIAILISLSALVGGLSAGYDVKIGIVFALVFFTAAILLFVYSVLKPK